jgi:hypothetical protein
MTSTAVAPAQANVKVGDFFVCSWGYDQTNVDYYKVVGLTPKGVKIQKWSMTATESSHASADYMVPGDGPVTRRFRDYETGEVTEYVEPVMTKRLQSYNGGESVYLNMTSYSNAYRWDGKPEYQTGWAYGH